MSMSHFNEHTLEMAIMELFEQQGACHYQQRLNNVHKRQYHTIVTLPFCEVPDPTKGVIIVVFRLLVCGS